MSNTVNVESYEEAYQRKVREDNEKANKCREIHAEALSVAEYERNKLSVDLSTISHGD